MPDVLDGVKPGDKLLLTSCNGTPWIADVLRVTPTGRVVTQYRTFRKDGSQIDNVYVTARAATPEDVTQVRLAERVRSVQWDKCPTVLLEAVLTLVEKDGEESASA